jgi:hypothetical protein
MISYYTSIYTSLPVYFHSRSKNKMANAQRTKNDIETIDRRKMVDRTVRDNRIRNDELTRERRLKADKTIDDNRLRNDEMTTNRRKMNDRNPWRTLAISLLILAILATLAIGAYLIFR